MQRQRDNMSQMVFLLMEHVFQERERERKARRVCVCLCVLKERFVFQSATFR